MYHSARNAKCAGLHILYFNERILTKQNEDGAARMNEKIISAHLFRRAFETRTDGARSRGEKNSGAIVNWIVAALCRFHVSTIYLEARLHDTAKRKWNSAPVIFSPVFCLAAHEITNIANSRTIQTKLRYPVETFHWREQSNFPLQGGIISQFSQIYFLLSFLSETQWKKF